MTAKKLPLLRCFVQPGSGSTIHARGMLEEFALKREGCRFVGKASEVFDNIEHLMHGSKGKSQACFPRISVFLETKSTDTLRSQWETKCTEYSLVTGVIRECSATKIFCGKQMACDEKFDFLKVARISLKNFVISLINFVISLNFCVVQHFPSFYNISGPVHTNAFSKTSVFCFLKTDKKFFVHTSVFVAFSTVHTTPPKTDKKTSVLLF